VALSGQQYTIGAGEHQATIAEVGASLRRYTLRGVDVTWPFSEVKIAPSGCGAVLVPWPNRLRGGRFAFDGVSYQLPLTEPDKGNAIHGLAQWVRWTPLAVEPAFVTLGIDLVPQNGWPFEIRVEVTYGLQAELGLTVTAVARNTGAGRAPFGAGFHPYLSLHGQPIDDVTLRLPAAERIVTDEVQLPIGQQAVSGTPHDFRRGRRLRGIRLDDGFTRLSLVDGRGSAELRTKSGGAALWFDAAFRYLQVFTREVPGDETAIAIEPMTCPPDAFNSGADLIVLEPSGVWTGTWGITPLPEPVRRRPMRTPRRR
jgi:aldose 1-epimerase